MSREEREGFQIPCPLCCLRGLRATLFSSVNSRTKIRCSVQGRNICDPFHGFRSALHMWLPAGRSGSRAGDGPSSTHPEQRDRKPLPAQRMKALIVSTVMALVACGCASNERVRQLNSVSPAERAYLKATVERDDFKKITRVSGSAIYIGKNDYTGNRYLRFLAGKPDRATEPAYFLIWGSESYSWCFWTELVDTNGARFKFERESSEAFGGRVSEVWSTTVSREYLNKMAESGMRVRVYGERTSEITFTISNCFPAGFLKRCDEVFSPK
jgi:hypothetical protein